MRNERTAEGQARGVGGADDEGEKAMESLPPWMCFTLAGVLGAVANAALGSKVIMLPRAEGHRVRLGFVGQLVLCISVAHVVDHNFQTAFFGALCGAGFLRHVKHRIEQAFEEGARGVDDDGK